VVKLTDIEDDVAVTDASGNVLTNTIVFPEQVHT